MAVTAADVTAYFPELASVGEPAITRWLGVAQLKHNTGAFGARSDIALICLTGHLVEMQRRRGAGATGTASLVQSRTVGDVTTTYATPTVGLGLENAALASTSYGQMYLDLRAGIFADRVLE